MTSRLAKKFNLPKLLKGDIKPDRIVKYTKGTGIPRQLIPLTEGMVGVGIYTRGRLLVYNKSGICTKVLGKIPYKFKNRKFAAQHSHGFLGKSTIDTINRKIYVAPIRSDIVEVYDFNGNIISTLQGPDNFFPIYKIVPVGEYHTITYTNKTRFGYMDICYNEGSQKTFLLYSGHYPINKKLNKNRNRCIYILDNSTDKLTKKITTGKDLFRIAVSEDGSTIYGLDGTSIFSIKHKKPII